jgi:hypothetical protein
MYLFQYSCPAPVTPVPLYPFIQGLTLSRYPATPLPPLSLYPRSSSTPLPHYPATPEDSRCESS